MSVKVGLETSSGSAAPRPRTIPLARVVLPAPRLPIRRTTPRRGSSRASRSPRAMVSSSEAVRYVGTGLHGLGKVLQQAGGEQAFVAGVLRGQFGGEAMQVDGGVHGLLRTAGELREH